MYIRGTMGFFDKIAKGLSKSSDNMVRELRGAFGKGELTEAALEEVEEKLLAADLSFEVAGRIIDGVREKAWGRDTDTDHLLGYMAETAESLLPEDYVWERKHKPHVMLVIGVNGAGKTTTIGKLAHRLHAQGQKVMVAAGDTFRAGAIQQLEVWANRVGAEVVKHAEGSDSASVAYDAYAAAKARNIDVLIIDTAGRLHNKTHLMEELKKLVRVLRKHDPDLPHESLLVIDGNTGQNAINQAKGFDEAVKLDGLIVTKLDGTAKGGSILPICREFRLPVIWVGVGEGADDLIPFRRAEYARALFQQREPTRKNEG